MKFVPAILGLVALLAIGRQFLPENTTPDYGSYSQSNEAAIPQYQTDAALPQYRSDAVMPTYTNDAVSPASFRRVPIGMMTAAQVDPGIAVPSSDDQTPETPAIPDTPQQTTTCPPGVSCPVTPKSAVTTNNYGSYGGFETYWYPVGSGGSTGSYQGGGSTGSYRGSGGSTGSYQGGGSTGSYTTSYRPVATVGCSNPNCQCASCDCENCICGMTGTLVYPSPMTYTMPMSSYTVPTQAYTMPMTRYAAVRPPMMAAVGSSRGYGLFGWRSQPGFFARLFGRR